MMTPTKHLLLNEENPITTNTNLTQPQNKYQKINTNVYGGTSKLFSQSAS